jgi:hypothetical protein
MIIDCGDHHRAEKILDLPTTRPAPDRGAPVDLSRVQRE